MVRNSLGDLVQWIYGKDGMDGAYIKKQTTEMFGLNDCEFEHNYEWMWWTLQEVFYLVCFRLVLTTVCSNCRWSWEEYAHLVEDCFKNLSAMAKNVQHELAYTSLWTVRATRRRWNLVWPQCWASIAWLRLLHEGHMTHPVDCTISVTWSIATWSVHHYLQVYKGVMYRR